MFFLHITRAAIRRKWITLVLLLILVLAAAFRFYGLRWDGYFGAYPHPDELHLANTMTRISLPWPLDWAKLLDAATSPLNPRRINPADGAHYDLAYGTLPIYIYRAVAATLAKLGYPSWNTYDGFYVVGRVVTVIFALITVVLAYAIGSTVCGPLAGLLGATFLALSVTHIQLSHFMTVDLALTMFVTGGLYWGLGFARRGGWRNALLLGLSLGGAMACKVSGATLLAAVVAVYVFWALGLSSRGERKPWLRGFGYLLLTILGFLLLFGTFEFYVFLDPRTYVEALSRQAAMVSGANDWPFTRQYVHTTPYLYHIENLVRFGLGWPLGLVSLVAVVLAALRVISALFPRRTELSSRKWWQNVLSAFSRDETLRGTALMLSWVVPYFLYIGRFEVKFTRYMLPLVPALCILAGWLTVRLAQHGGRFVQRLSLSEWGRQHLHSDPASEESHRPWSQTVGQVVIVLLVVVPTFVYALAFLRIYRQPHTWLDASRWLYANAPRGAAMSAESWDNDLPVDIVPEGHTRAEFAPNVKMDIYHDMSPEDKFQHLLQAMRSCDYIILATPRLYGAVRRLPWRYPVEIKYYELLFSEKLGFELAHVSMSYPGIWGLTFVDDEADESFSVYDHPKVLIYRKVRDLSEQELRSLFGDVLKVKPMVTRSGDEPPVELPVPRYRKSLMLDVSVDALPPVNDYAWNRWGSAHTLPAVLIWLLAFTVVSLLTFPVSLAIFGSFADRGYLLAKPLGLLLVAYFTWMPVSLGFWHYTVGAVILAVLLVGLLSYAVVYRRREMIRAFWRKERNLVLRCEIVFLVAFLFSLFLRLGNPDLWHPVNGGEKPMEFGFLNAILRSSTMPPYDPFFAGGYINYYYYGLFIVSTLVKLTGLAPAVAFNLIIPTLFAMTVSTAYAIVATLTGRHVFGWIGGICTALIGPLSGATTIRGRGGFGEVVAALQRLADPNIQGALSRSWQGFWRWLGPEILPLRTDWFWDASRTHGSYENTITEFPFWSFLFADLHPHTINIAFTVLVIALALRLARVRSRSEAYPALSLAPGALFLVVAVALGALTVTNSWDFPSFLLLVAGGILLGHVSLGKDRPVSFWRRLWATLGSTLMGTLLLAPLSLALYFPFFTHFQAFVKGIGRTTYPTEVNYYVGFFGFFLFLLASYALWKALERSLATPAGKALLAVGLQPTASEVSRDLLKEQEAVLAEATPQTPPAEGAAQQTTRVTEELPSQTGPVEATTISIDSPLASPDKETIASGAEGEAPVLLPIEPERELDDSSLAPLPTEGNTVREVATQQQAPQPGFVTRSWLLWASLALFVLVPLVIRPLYPRLNWRQVATFWLIAELLFLLVADLLKRKASPEERFVAWLALVGLLVSLGVEVVYIRDHLGESWYRMNTIFKFYVHTWVILAVAAAAGFGLLWQSRRLQRQNTTTTIWWSLFGVMGLAVLLYPVFAVQSRWRDRFPAPPEWGTLDGLAYMKTGVYNWEGHEIFLDADYEAIHWLMDNLKGTPVILQAPYGFYRENGVRVATNTGYPTVLNPLHENEQRYDELIGPRHRDADQIYKSTDIEEAVRLLARYGVGYVYVGSFEREVYPAPGLAKFDAMIADYLDLVYDENLVRIYRVRDRVRQLYGGLVLQAAKPVVVPTVAPRPATALEKDALRNLERAADTNPDNPGLQFDLGDRYRQLGRLEDAIRVFQRSLKYHPEDVAMHHTLGDTYAQTGELDKALDQYIQATKVAPDNPAAFNKLGLAYLERSRWTEAVDAFQRAIQVNPKFAEAYFHLGEAYERLGDRPAARKAYRDAQEQGPGTDWETRASERLRALPE